MDLSIEQSVLLQSHLVTLKPQKSDIDMWEKCRGNVQVFCLKVNAMQYNVQTIIVLVIILNHLFSVFISILGCCAFLIFELFY